MEWVPYVSLPEVTPAAIAQLEGERGHKLPQDYIQAVIEHRGDIPRPGSADVGSGIASVSTLFFIDKDFQGKGNSYNSWFYIEKLDDELPDRLGADLIPFSFNGGQGVFVFDYRLGSAPTVAFVDLDIADEGEDAIIPVADSFGDFLSKLHD